MSIIEKESNFAKRILQAFVDDIVEAELYRGELTLEIKKDSLLRIAASLKGDESYRMEFLSDVVGVDYNCDEPRFAVVYHLYSIQNNLRLRLKVRLRDGEPVPSVTSLWHSAIWSEREAYDMFGIVFDGHPDLKRIYLAEDFDGWPLRKDFPLRGYKDEYNPFGEEKK